MAASPVPAAMTAVIAAFEPDAHVVQRVSRLAAQVERVVVVDDGSSSDARATLDRVDSVPGVEVLRLGANGGIAAALNAGVRRAFSGGAEVVLTLDQDSTVPEDYAAEAMAALRRLDAAGRPLAVLAAGVQSGERVRPVRFEDRGHRITPTLEAIQSGLVIRRAVFDRVGGFDERLFIDCVDTDWVLRAAAAGVPTYLVRSCAIEHPLGREIATGPVRATRSGRHAFAFHPAWRRYYISRNRAIVFARHGIHRPDWAAAGLAGEIVQLARSLLFGPEKLQQGAAVALGLSDALLGRRGRLAGTGAAVLGAPR